MRAPPSTLELLEAVALAQPARLALQEDGAALSYGHLHAMLLRCMAHLHQLGLRPGERVAVSGPGFGLQLVLLIAAEALGAVTASFRGEQDGDAPALFALMDWVFSPLPQQCPAQVRFVPVDAAFRHLLAQPPPAGEGARAARELHELQRITRTAGSTGRSKFMRLSRQAQEGLIRSVEGMGHSQEARLLIMSPLVLNSAFVRSSAMLRQGGAVLVGPGASLPELAPTRVWGLPLQIEQLLREAPAGYVAPRPVPVDTTGGVVSPALRARIARVFGGPVLSRYGSNEAGALCDDVDANGVGPLRPGVDIRILGPGGEVLPDGVDGVIAARTPTMVDGYIDQPESVNAMFRDGWFVSGDVGALIGARLLRLAGRHDALVTVAGLKLPAAELEARLRQLPAVADCCAQTVHLQGGAVTLGLALVLAPGATLAEASAQIEGALHVVADATARLLVLAELPQLPGGKPDRIALLRLFQAQR